MSTVHARELNRRAGAVRGDPDVITDALIKAGVTFRWDRRERRYVIPLHAAAFDRVLAALELAGHRVEFPAAALW